ncbi:hypothetical protein AAOGI_41350 [Agarivorans albus]
MYKYFLMFMLLSVSASAAVTNSYIGKVAGLRIEGTSALITLSSYLEDAEPRCNRVWLDVATNDADKAAYSTFLMAFSADKTVYIRAIKAGNRRYGACDFYDVYLPRQ